jgi:arylsulfatase A-like enzyme
MFKALVATVCLMCATTVDARNLILIMADDMRYHAQAITPNIDALAAQSTVYGRGYVTATWCLPSRTSLMFGQSPDTHRVGVARAVPDFNGPPYTDTYNNPALKTLPEVFSDNGYTTAVTGKIFHEPQPSRWDVNGPDTDFTTLYGIFDPGPDGTFIINAPTTEVHQDQIIADWASDFITNQNAPFFLAVGFHQPHLPWIAPQWAYDLYPNVTAAVPLVGDFDDEPVIAKQWADGSPWFGGVLQYDIIDAAGKAQDYTQGYLAAVTHTDAMLGQVLAALDASPHAADTDVIFLSDHGWHLGEKRHWRKQTLWENTINVPMIIRSPNHPPQVVTTPVTALDIPSTALAMAGIPPFAQFEGGPMGTSDVQVFSGDAVATIFGDVKLIDYDRNVSTIDDLAAYNVATDPNEYENIIIPLIIAILNSI